QKGENKMLHAELTDKIISSFFKVYYENQMVGDYFADIIADQVILEIKAAEGLREENKAQLEIY
ncbi:MAG: GxxExxY protein, partial [ANME-2 cluster archaeon]|nr:GxxExxY protein [ANME-2 cluster archaeon]